MIVMSIKALGVHVIALNVCIFDLLTYEPLNDNTRTIDIWRGEIDHNSRLITRIGANRVP
jgi:hypothetical protein